MIDGYVTVCIVARPAVARYVGEIHMRGFSIVLTLAFVLATPSLAGSSEQGAPGVGTFAYGGSPLVASLTPLTVAAR